MRINKLSASDFPGIDEAKFNEWKVIKLKDIQSCSVYSYLGLHSDYLGLP